MARKRKRPKPKKSRGSMMALRKSRGDGLRIHAGADARPCTKFIPNADREFAAMAERFAKTVSEDPALYNIAEADAKMLVRLVREYRAALDRIRGEGRCATAAVRQKNKARTAAEEYVRTTANQIRGDATIEQQHKDTLKLWQRSKTLGKRECPDTAPILKYLCEIDKEGSVRAGAGGVHVVEFRDMDMASSERKPEGAASLHLYFDLVQPGEPIPQHPAERGWPKFLREFTRSPMKIEFPVPLSGPMAVVYWGRWSDGKGATGPWSPPCEARVVGKLAIAALREGGSGRHDDPAREQRMVIIQPPRQLVGKVAPSADKDEAEAAAKVEAAAALAALMGSMGGGQYVREAATVRMLNAA